MTNFYELADNNRADLIFTKDQLLARFRQGMLPPPFPMAEGMEERDYYQGKVASSHRRAANATTSTPTSRQDEFDPARRTVGRATPTRRTR